jgi:PAS domain S-box-containing protein
LERKRAEEQLRQAHEELEERVRERTAELTLANKALTQSEERFRTLFENVSVGVYRSHPDGRMINANPAFLKILGYSSLEQLLTRNTQVEEYGPEYSKSQFRERLERDGEIRGLESVLRRLDGQMIYVRENARLIRDTAGNSVYHEGTVEDITERKKIEQMKDELIAIVGHELRAPLTSIRGSLSYISNSMSDQLTPRVKKLIDLASRGSERLVRLINDMLDIDRIESGKMEFHLKPFELAPVIEYAIEANRAYADNFQVHFHLDGESLPGAKVRADSDRLVQVLTNLLTNAAKFSPANEVVRVSVSRLQNQIRVAVADRGPGIPDDFRKHIFEKFAQASTHQSGDRRGSGLGLCISKAIMEKLGGNIHFETEIGSGTTFFLDLPEWSGN